MKNLSRILCVVELGNDRQPALERAAWLSASAGAQLDIVSCTYNEYLSGQRLSDAPSLGKAREDLVASDLARVDKLAEPLRESGLKVSVHAVWDHPPHEAIVRYAVSSKADMVFKDTHEHSAISRLVLTNTDWQLIRCCPIPLWLVKPGEPTQPPVFVAAIDPMNLHDKPAALDDSILVTSKLLVAHCGGAVHAFHAYDPHVAVAAATANAYMPVSILYDEIRDQMRESHGDRFNEVTSYHAIDEQHRHLVSGRTEEELPKLASKLGATVVIMGAVARNRWKRLYIGATAERTLDRLPCDQLIIKPDWFQTPVEILADKDRTTEEF